MSSPIAHTIAIIGGGFSGTLVAANLLRRGSGSLRVVLIDRRLPAGPGVAYASSYTEHVLNVPAGRMSAWPDAPDHFLAWVQEMAPTDQRRHTRGDFLGRGLYGHYLQQVLSEAVRDTATEYVELQAEVVDIEACSGGARLALSNGGSVDANQVVLAVGNLPGPYPIGRPLPVYTTDRYIHVPWRGDPLARIAADEDVLLIGHGLTAADVALAGAGHRGAIHAVSRHGLAAQSHRRTRRYVRFMAREPAPSSALALVRRVRAEIRRATARGADWRAVIDALRPDTPRLWQALSWGERARFLRHVRSFWDVHRHRVAPEVRARLESLRASGQLRHCAGRLQSLDVDPAGVHALIRLRGTFRHILLRVGHVINCAGPRTDYSKYQHPLFVHLLARGLIDHDPLALGINALPSGQVLRYRGGAVPWLWTLGAPLKGVLWETNAVPELREQACDLALRLLTLVPASGSVRRHLAAAG